MNKTVLIAMIGLLTTLLVGQAVAGSITITRSGASVDEFVDGDNHSLEDSIYDHGILLGDGFGKATPVYRILLPPPTSGDNQITSITVTIEGNDGWLSNPHVYIGTSVQVSESIGDGEYVFNFTESDARNLLASVGDGLGYTIDVKIDVGGLTDKYDLKEIKVTYEYSGVSSDILERFAQAYSSYRTLKEYEFGMVDSLWDTGEWSAKEYFYPAVQQSLAFADNLAGLSGSLYDSLKSTINCIENFQSLGEILESAFDYTFFWINYDGPSKNTASSELIDARNSFKAYAQHLFDYAFDGDISSSDTTQLNSDIDTAKTKTIVLRQTMRDVGQESWGVYISHDNGNGKSTAQIMLYSLAPLLNIAYDENSCHSEPSYLTGLIDKLSHFSGDISGVVTADSDGQPIAGLTVWAHDYSNGNNWGYAQTQSDGSYIITGLPPGSYRVNVGSGAADYAGEYYDNTYDYILATPVAVTTGQTTSGINFSLAIGGKITGVVTRDSDGQPIAGISIDYYDWDATSWGSIFDIRTQSDGSYIITGLAPGSYGVMASGTDYISEYYDRPVVVTAGQTTSGIDFGLAIGGKITGVVKRASDGQPIADMWVKAYSSTGGIFLKTQSDGSYIIPRLPAGSYRVNVNTDGTDYVQEYYDNAYDENSATLLEVKLGQTTSGIDFQLDITIIVDSDNDGLSGAIEAILGTDPNDADTDNDGIPDGVEDANHNGVVDPGETDSCLADTDGDGIQDGTELGITAPVADPDGDGPLLGTDTNIFIQDADPTTTTHPLCEDTDGDGLTDGEEDPNHNGMVDPGELDPNHVQGDVDGDGDVDLEDSILALQVMAGIERSTSIYKEADVNGDGKIGIEEVIYILQKVAGLRD